jgi:hypothetical protein
MRKTDLFGYWKKMKTLGFLLFEVDSADSFLDWWSKFKDTIRWYVEQTHIVTARRR